MSHLATFDFYLLRMPVLPYNNILMQLQQGDDMEAFKAIIEQPLYQEAIFLASTELYAAMQKWLKDNATIKKDKLNASIYKYLVRMATRSTPYGLFAGCAIGNIAATATNIDLEEKRTDRLYRLDIGCFTELADVVPFLTEELLQETIFFSNSSIYPVGETYRYYEHKIINTKRSYYLSSFSKNDFIDNVLMYAMHGASFNTLKAYLIKMDVDEEEANAYLITLVQNQILIAEYEPKLTGGNQLQALITMLEGREKGKTNIIEELIKLNQLLLNEYNSIIKYPIATDILKKLIPDLKQRDYIQADISFNLKINTLNNASINTIVSQLEQLLPLNTATNSNDLTKFKNNFYQKFEDREIPLFEALDSDLGVGYGKITGEETFYTPLIDDLIIANETSNNIKKWNAYEEFILNKYLQFQNTNNTQLFITDEDLATLDKDIKSERKQAIPATFAVLGSIFAESQASFDQLKFSFLLKNFGGNSAISLISRFGSENNTIAEALQNVVNYEKELATDKVLAEIIHLPEGRVGNVLVRAKTFDYEIPFLGKAAVDEAFKINVNDLFVSVKNGRIVLRSKRLNKEVLPRLTNAHNFSNSLPVYKFLCDLQFQNEGLSMDWNWGILSKQPFLPRVIYKNIILKRSRWFISSTNNKVKDVDSATALFAFKATYKLPDLIILAEGDNELFLDLTNEIAKLILIGKIGKQDIVLYECLHSNDGALLSNGSKFFDNEIVLPIKNKEYFSIPANKQTQAFNQYSNKFFTAGSEWLYIKIYSGYKSLDTILTDMIMPLITEFSNKGEIKQWFFVRYQDPESHLRIRFNTANSAVSYQLIKAIDKLVADYIENRIVQKLEYGTYFPEIEKYTAWGIDLCEYVFYIDSRTVLNIVNTIQFNKDEESRWLVAIKGVDVLLQDFNYSVEEKKELMDNCFMSFFKEFNGDKELMVQLNNKYRDKKIIINQLLIEQQNSLPEEINDFIKKRSLYLSGVYAELLNRIEQQNADKIIINKLVNNFVHLYLNRLFVANHRLHELVVYHHLLRYYESVLARSSKLEVKNIK